MMPPMLLQWTLGKTSVFRRWGLMNLNNVTFSAHLYRTFANLSGYLLLKPTLNWLWHWYPWCNLSSWFCRYTVAIMPFGRAEEYALWLAACMDSSCSRVHKTQECMKAEGRVLVHPPLEATVLRKTQRAERSTQNVYWRAVDSSAKSWNCWNCVRKRPIAFEAHAIPTSRRHTHTHTCSSDCSGPRFNDPLVIAGQGTIGKDWRHGRVGSFANCLHGLVLSFKLETKRWRWYHQVKTEFLHSNAPYTLMMHLSRLSLMFFHEHVLKISGDSWADDQGAESIMAGF